ncbi:MAG TPA: gamma-glutamyltransferase, partial [Baekduia sp.]|nr:gamma-glutamyltransferase [Baekduia sp.]
VASEAGLDVLRQGGNAIDAAVTTVFAVGVSQPQLCGIGGGGFLVYRSGDGRTATTLDFREKAPSTYAFTPGLFGGTVFGTGHGVVGVPGTVAGMAAALDRYGSIPLARTVAPAERLARDGVPVTPDLARDSAQNRPRLLLYPESARIYTRNGAPLAEGDRLVQADYAASLQRIGRDGPTAFYDGPIGAAIVRSMEGSGTYPGDRGTLTAADLRAYRPVWREPVRTTYRGHEVLGMGPPSSGGVALAETLELLEGFDLRAEGRLSTAHLHLLAEAQKVAWADRNEYLGDPDHVQVPVGTLVSQEYATRRRAEIHPLRAGTYKPGLGPRAPAATDRAAGDHAGHTTHVSVIDRDGNAVAVTCTIEQLFGSAVVAPGTGFLLNNQLTDFGAPGTANAPAPGKRPRSSMTPTIVARHGVARLAAGGAGGPSIIGGAVHAVLNVVDFDLDVARAVEAPRSDARGTCAGEGLQLCLEGGRIAPPVIAELRGRGHAVTDLGEYAPRPAVQAVGTDLRSGEREGTAEPRTGDAAAAEGFGRGALGEPGVPAARVRVRRSPGRLTAGRRTRVRVRVDVERGAERRPSAGALVRLLGVRARTDGRGVARLVVAPRTAGLRRLTVEAPGVPRTARRIRVDRPVRAR